MDTPWPAVIKMRFMKSLRFLACGLLAGRCIITAYGDDKVSGTFTVKGKPTELHHVYAFWKPRLMDEARIDLYVLLSDEAILPDALPKNDDGLSKIAALVRENRIHAIELHFDVDGDRLFEGEQGAVYHSAIAMARQGETGMIHYQPDKSGPGEKAGKLFLDREMAEQLGWNVTAAFEVSVPAKP